MHPGHPHPVSCAHSGVIVGVSVSHYLLETSRVVFQVRPTRQLTPSQLLQWQRRRGHCGGPWSLSRQAGLPQDLPSLPWAQGLATVPAKPGLSPRPRLSGASMSFTSCWRGWTLGSGSSCPCRSRRATTTSTRWGQARSAPQGLPREGSQCRGVRRSRRGAGQVLPPPLLCSAGQGLQAPGQGGRPGLHRAGEGPADAGLVPRGADGSLGRAGHHPASGQHLLLLLRGALPLRRWTTRLVCTVRAAMTRPTACIRMWVTVEPRPPSVRTAALRSRQTLIG